MIKIRPSPTADTRTCDWSKVTKETLLASSLQHIDDVRRGLEFFMDAVWAAAKVHDHDKITAIDHFHADFQTGFKQTGWWDNHRKVNRHHLLEADGIPEDVNLIDVLDHITDCVMAGMARSGSVRPLALPAELLERAFQNTVALLQAHVEVEPSAEPPRDEPGTGEEGAKPAHGSDARGLPDGSIVTCDYCQFPHPKGDDGRPCSFPKAWAPDTSAAPGLTRRDDKETTNG